MLVPLIRPTTQQPGQLTLSVQQLVMPFKMFIFFGDEQIRKKLRAGECEPDLTRACCTNIGVLFGDMATIACSDRRNLRYILLSVQGTRPPERDFMPGTCHLC
jgi:hypothetical protein